MNIWFAFNGFIGLLLLFIMCIHLLIMCVLWLSAKKKLRDIERGALRRPDEDSEDLDKKNKKICSTLIAFMFVLVGSGYALMYLTLWFKLLASPFILFLVTLPGAWLILKVFFVLLPLRGEINQYTKVKIPKKNEIPKKVEEFKSFLETEIKSFLETVKKLPPRPKVSLEEDETRSHEELGLRIHNTDASEQEDETRSHEELGFVDELKGFLRTFLLFLHRLKKLSSFGEFLKRIEKGYGKTSFWFSTIFAIAVGIMLGVGILFYPSTVAIFLMMLGLIFLVLLEIIVGILYYFLGAEEKRREKEEKNEKEKKAKEVTEEEKVGRRAYYYASIAMRLSLIFTSTSLTLVIGSSIFVIKTSFLYFFPTLIIFLLILNMFFISLHFVSPQAMKFWEEISRQTASNSQRNAISSNEEEHERYEMYIFLMGSLSFGLLLALTYETIFPVVSSTFHPFVIPIIDTSALVVFTCGWVIGKQKIMNAFTIKDIYEASLETLLEEWLIFTLMGFSTPTILLLPILVNTYIISTKLLIWVVAVCGFLSLLHVYISLSHIKGINVSLRHKISYEFTLSLINLSSIVETISKHPKPWSLTNLYIGILKEAYNSYSKSKTLYTKGYKFLHTHIMRKIFYSLPSIIATGIGFGLIFLTSPVIPPNILFNIALTYFTAMFYVLISIYRVRRKYLRFIRALEEPREVRNDLVNKILGISTITFVGYYMTSLKLSIMDIFLIPLYLCGLLLMGIMWILTSLPISMVEEYYFTILNKELLRGYNTTFDILNKEIKKHQRTQNTQHST